MSLGDDFEREDFELGFDGVEEDVEDDSDDEELMVIFGFVQVVEELWKMVRQYFLCKIGGMLVWLDFINIFEGDNI